MPNLTLVISEELKLEMERHPSIKWSSAVRNIIEQKLAEFGEVEEIARKSKLTWKHWKPIEKQIAKRAAEHAKALLNETNH